MTDMIETKDITTSDLKPCPFCGGEAALKKGKSVYSIVCAEGSSCIGGGLLIGFKHDALESAVAQWNTRADLSQAAIAAAMMGAVQGAIDKMAGNAVQRMQDAEFADPVDGVKIWSTVADELQAISAKICALREELELWD